MTESICERTARVNGVATIFAVPHIIMNKLNYFHFNNVFFKSRVFANYARHVGELLPETVLPGWLELFAKDFCEEDAVCQERLFRLVGMGCKTLMTTRHFVDDAGEAWPQETFVVLEDDRPESRFVLVVACERRK